MQIRSFIISTICATALSACSKNSIDSQNASEQGQMIYAKECSQCHGTRAGGAGAASLGLGVAPPDLVSLNQRNNGEFPRVFIRRYVLAMLGEDDPNAAMPEFALVGFAHVYPNGGADGEVLETDFDALLDYLEAIQE